MSAYRDSSRVGSSDPEIGITRRLEMFLDSHPRAPLTVVTQKPTPKGIVWLASQCIDRPVRLVIGSYRESSFSKASVEDRRRTAEFFERDDVLVMSWGGGGASVLDANFRAWVAHVDPVPAVLIPSADLVHKNREKTWGLAAEVSDRDRRQVITQVERVTAQAQDHKRALIDLMAVSQSRNPSRRDLDADRWWNRRESEPDSTSPKARWRGRAKSQR